MRLNRSPMIEISNGAVASLSSSRATFTWRVTSRNARPWSAKSSRSQFLVSARSRPWHGPRCWAGACTSCFIRRRRRRRAARNRAHHSALLAPLGTALRGCTSAGGVRRINDSWGRRTCAKTTSPARVVKSAAKSVACLNQLSNAHAMSGLINYLYQACSGSETKLYHLLNF